MNYGNIFSLWRAEAGHNWTRYVEHEFVAGLADGSLPRNAYLHYLKQDYVFLIHFSRAWALAITKAETVEEMRTCAGIVHALINEEIALHVKVCAEAGICEAELFDTEERTENLAYTRYVLDAGHSGDFLDLLATLAPCVMGYGEIGARLGQSSDQSNYGDWINTYAGPQYQELCTAAGELIDKSVSHRLGENPETCPRWKTLCKRFDMATKLEIGFWDMGLKP